jgi:hypothetical protein
VKTSERTVEMLLDQVDYVTASPEDREWCELDALVVADIAHDLAQARARTVAINALVEGLRAEKAPGSVGPFIAQEIENRLAAADASAVEIVAVIRAALKDSP